MKIFCKASKVGRVDGLKPPNSVSLRILLFPQEENEELKNRLANWFLTVA
jgi:hypothetical protein